MTATKQFAEGIARLGMLRARIDLVRAATWSKYAVVRAAAASALGSFAIPGDLGRLMQLAQDANSLVQMAACHSLGMGRYQAADALLLDMASDVSLDQGVRRHAAMAAARILSGMQGHPGFAEAEFKMIAVLDTLHKERVFRRSDYYRALGSIRSAKSRKILEDLTEKALETGLPVVRDASYLLKSLRKTPLTPRGVQLMVRALDALPGGRAEAARTLTRYPSPQARPALERLLHDPNPELARLCDAALRTLGVGSAVQRPQPQPCGGEALTAHVLHELCAAEGARAAEQACMTGPAGLRHVALNLLVRLDPQRGLALCKELVNDTNAQVRQLALRTLMRRTPETARWRSAAAADPVEWVRRLAAETQHARQAAQGAGAGL